MANTNEKTKLIVVESKGTLGELGGISGPILSPSLIPISTIIRMISAHRKVYEVNPANYNERIALTLQNVRRDNFNTITEEPAVNTTPGPKSGNIVTAPKPSEKAKEVETKPAASAESAKKEEKAKKSDFSTKK